MSLLAIDVGAGLEPLLMDTGQAAIFGDALYLPDDSPALIINFGNVHTVAALLAEGRITSIFEHHTSELSLEKLAEFTEKLCNGTLKTSDVFENGGHGAYIDSVPDRIGSIRKEDLWR